MTYASAHNGKRLQANSGAPSAGVAGCGAHYFINYLKGAANFWISVTGDNPMDPDNFDDDNYPTVITNGGVYTTYDVPSQVERIGLHVIDWTGDGTVTTASMNQTPFTLNITGLVSNTAGRQTYQLSGTVSPALIAGMAVAISGFTSSGSPNWTGANATQPIESVDAVNNRITINSGTTFGGSPANFTSTKITSVNTTTTAQGPLGYGRYVLRPSVTTGLGAQLGQLAVTAVASSSNYPKNIRHYHIDDSAIVDTEIFSPLAKSLLGANFGCFRDLGWTYGVANQCTTTNWASRKSVSCVYYDQPLMKKSWNAGATSSSVSSSGLTYTAGRLPSIHAADGSTWSPGDGPRHRDIAHATTDKGAAVVITAAVSNGANTDLTIANASSDTGFAAGEKVRIYGFGNGSGAGWTALNINTIVGAVVGNVITVPINSSTFTGTPTFGTIAHRIITFTINGVAYPIFDGYSNAIYNRTDWWPVGTGAKRLVTLVFDGALGGWMLMFRGFGCHIPPEIFARWCWENGQHAWLIASAWAIEGPTDYIPELMKYYRDNQPSWHKPKFEGPNETWNTANNFWQTPYAINIQMLDNGATVVDGAVTSGTYNVSAVVYPVDIAGNAWVSGTKYSKITFSTTGNAFKKGSRANTSVSGWGGLSGFGNLSVYVAAINIGGDPNTIIYTGVPASGTYTSGGSMFPNTGDHYNCYGKWMSTIGQMARAVFGSYPGAATNFDVMLGLQHTDSSSNADSRFEAYSYVMRGAPVRSVTYSGGTINFTATAAAPATGSTATNLVSHIAPASYWRPSAINNSADTTYAAAYSGSQFTAKIVSGVMTVSGWSSSSGANLTVGATITGGLPEIPSGTTITSQLNGTAGQNGDYQLSNATLTVVDAATGTNYTQTLYAGVDMTAPNSWLATALDNVSLAIPQVAVVNAAWATFANTKNIKKMAAYEGGPACDPVSTSLDLMHRRGRMSPDMFTMHYNSLQDFIGQGSVSYPSGFVAEWPSLFQPTGAYPSGNFWQVLEDVYVPSPPGAWTSSVLWSAGKARLRVKT